MSTGVRSGRGRILAVLGGLAVALLVLCLPVGLIETIVASSGLSEAVPAAAPPLGMTARLIVAGFAGLMMMGLMGFTRRTPQEVSARDDEQGQDEQGRIKSAQGAKTMGFAFSKLTAMARRRAVPVDVPETPSLRRADAHPDAPPRPPIFASRDFDGVDIFARPQAGRRSLVAHRETEPEAVLPTPGFVASFAAPNAPMPLADEALPQPAFLRPAAPFAPIADPMDMEDEGDEAKWEAVAPAPPPPPVEPRLAPLPMRAPTQGLSVLQLTERLERGLALRSRVNPAQAASHVIADMPVAAAVPVREEVARDTDEALRAALGALRTMAGRR
ncbi:hypothetical protein Q4610_04045 [Sphingobium sp. HBC34]|uniref:Uncharacterized protein n=1 Tax=Sphingobium cyanobacteriorum TaxID=3063954 RepID=A0ABT8ZI42_9SPHN|nr:hypothetical protein [Sphingobium sp. HBC34]MDO7834210.1 hypothetical protein [Sphingobium sp. HBC34]